MYVCSRCGWYTQNADWISSHVQRKESCIPYMCDEEPRMLDFTQKIDEYVKTETQAIYDAYGVTPQTFAAVEELKKNGWFIMKYKVRWEAGAGWLEQGGLATEAFPCGSLAQRRGQDCCATGGVSCCSLAQWKAADYRQTL